MILPRKKLSKANERDFNFYFNNRRAFSFSGTLENSYEPILERAGISGVEAFFRIENFGSKAFPLIRQGVRGVPCRHPRMLETLLLAKASVNFNIRLWAEDRAAGYLPKVIFEDILKEYKCPEWVRTAVENQKFIYYKPN